MNEILSNHWRCVGGLIYRLSYVCERVCERESELAMLYESDVQHVGVFSLSALQHNKTHTHNIIEGYGLILMVFQRIRRKSNNVRLTNTQAAIRNNIVITIIIIPIAM